MATAVHNGHHLQHLIQAYNQDILSPMRAPFLISLVALTAIAIFASYQIACIAGGILMVHVGVGIAASVINLKKSLEARHMQMMLVSPGFFQFAEQYPKIYVDYEEMKRAFEQFSDGEYKSRWGQ
jgi:hypothetical protein